MRDIACICGHGSTQHVEGTIGYRCTQCACVMLQSRPGEFVEVPDDEQDGGFRYFLVRPERMGGHIHVHVWGGTLAQQRNASRPKLGTLIMSPEDWEALATGLDDGLNHERCSITIVDQGGAS